MNTAICILGIREVLTMTDAEARAILTTYGAPVNIAKHIEAINTAIRALGGKATMAEIWEWAGKPEKEVNEC